MQLGEVKDGQIFIIIEPGGREVIYKKIESDRETIAVKEVSVKDSEMEVTELLSYFQHSCFDMEVKLYRSMEVKI